MKLTALLVPRQGELRRACWQEFDLERQVWTVPAARMKMRRPHRVPLSPAAMAVLEDLRSITGRGHLVFPSLRSSRRPISENTFNVALRGMGYGKEAMTAHGFPASFSTIANGTRARRAGSRNWRGRCCPFGGVPEEVLRDNPRALVQRHDVASRHVTFNENLLAFARHWGFRPRACTPYRARTKGKTENGVGYVKKNATAGHAFATWKTFEAHLAGRERDIANVRLDGTTVEVPMVRFERDEAHRLQPLGGRPWFGSLPELSRVVGNDCAVQVDTNSHSVPWRLRMSSVGPASWLSTLSFRRPGPRARRGDAGRENFPTFATRAVGLTGDPRGPGVAGPRRRASAVPSRPVRGRRLRHGGACPRQRSHRRTASCRAGARGRHRPREFAPTLDNSPRHAGAFRQALADHHPTGGDGS